MKSLIVTIALLFAVAQLIECDKVCKTNTDCGVGECCYIRPQFQVVSRKRQGGILQPVQPFVPTQDDTGVCESYKMEHEHCWALMTANGHCGCNTGLSCQFIPAETIQPVLIDKPLQVSKKDIYMPGSVGSYQCEKIIVK